jgi:hypothetical protein
MTSRTNTHPPFADLWTRPGRLVAEHTLTVLEPALPRLAYVCGEMEIGRSPLTALCPDLRTTAAEIASAALPSATSQTLPARAAGGNGQPAQTAVQTMTDAPPEHLVWRTTGRARRWVLANARSR